MSKRDNEKLYDITLALALFVENIKIGQLLEFNAVLKDVDLELRKTLGQVKTKKLDGLTKAELSKLILTLRKAQLRIYSAYTEKLIRNRQAFMKMRLDVGAIAYGSA